ncbi:unnamed protein product [Candida verbasci]|uniref:Ribosomal RNA-processing protein 12-like conserved domain-containing protein n=1 Tax=Candida verbasci TaxID=1227364 RepID=A0A9W4XII8_9ASCO|nr:unnamed protein product [Candida verbasci]
MSDTNPDGGLSKESIELDDKLSRIRTQINSKLENQKHLSIILSAVEENIEEQNNSKTPVTYFVSFLSLLDQCIQNDQMLDQQLAATTAYFLDLIFPFTPKSLLKSKFSEILVKLSQPLSLKSSDAPLIRSTIGALESLLLAQDFQQWNQSKNNQVSPQRAFLALLESSFDPRPKVRKRAQDAVQKILANRPTSPSPTHIAAPLASDIALKQLINLMDSYKKKKGDKELNSQIIHCLQLITIITSSNSWPAQQIEQLCDILLDISKTSDQYLVSYSFKAFEGLFKSMTNIVDVEKFTKVLNIIFDLKPSINDTHLAASWLAVIAKALESFAQLSPVTCIEKLPHILSLVSQFLASEHQDISESASQCLIAIISQTIPDKFLLNPGVEGVTQEIYELIDDTITFISELIENELFSIKYQHATKEILEFVTLTIEKLRIRSNPDFISILEIVGSWRTNETENFKYNKEAEDLISASISSMGPEVVLGALPLNLSGGGPGRAWLLPLLRNNVRFAELEFYKKQILPNVEFFENKINQSQNKESLNNKVFQTIIDQIWSILPHFCDLPKDLTKAFDEAFATKLAELMFANVELRVSICHSWRLLVESNLAYADGALNDDLMMLQEFSIEQAQKNIEYLKSISSNILTVLFNIFTYTMPESRGFVLETIETYLQIIPKDELANTFDKVCEMLKNAMDEEKSKPQQANKDATPDQSVTMMDLIVAMAKYVPESSHNALFSIFSTTVSLDNALLQKRSYRIITKLLETEQGKQSILKFISDIESVIIKTSDITNNSARSARLTSILSILEVLPLSDLYFIPSILQEIIMATKDVNERSRGLSYQILIRCGQLMKNGEQQGGIIDNSKVPGFDSTTPSTNASLVEFFTMVSAGLASSNAHMISATITAISCLIFEFKNDIPVETLLEITSTIELFLTHNSREIAKSAIGFVKVEILSLPEELVKQNLNELLTKLMRWSHEHKGHFKSKVKHILERLIRKFGIEEIENNIPEEDKKLIQNIKKSKNRAKRKQEEEAQQAQQQSQPTENKFISAYEEALYDSDISDGEEGVDIYDEDKIRYGNKKKQSNQYILESGDEPLNLLDRQALANISSSKPKKGQQSIKSKTEEFKTKNGKLVLDDKDEDPLANKGSGIDAYLDAVTQAPVRGQKNKLKFKKTKGDENENWSDDEDKRPSKKQKVANSRISKPQKKQKFKAKKKL